MPLHVHAQARGDEEAGIAAEQRGELREAFMSYVTALHALPDPPPIEDDRRLRERIIKLVARMKPPPLVPEEAERHATWGAVALKEAQDAKGYRKAASEFRKAIRIAPWWPPVSLNLALVQEKLDQYDAAIANLRLCLLAVPDSPKAGEVRKKIYEIEYKIERLKAELQAPGPAAIGVLVGALSERAKKDHGLVESQGGVEVLHVYPSGPASLSGLERDVIEAMDGTAVRSVEDFLDQVTRRQVGQEVALRVLRGARAIELRLTLANRVALYKQACDGGDGDACSGLAAMYYNAQGVATDKARAAALYEQACDLGDPNGCLTLGWLFDKGEVVARDKARAAALYKQACEGGNAMGCYNLGVKHDDGDGVPDDKVRAAALYQRACDGGHAKGCFNLAVMHERGGGVAMDKARATDLYRKACDSGLAEGCASSDKARAVPLYQKACDGGDMDGCRELGLIYASGEGVPIDKARAVGLFRQACNGGNARGCSNLGLMYEYGDGVARDKFAAAALYEKACDAGVLVSCYNLAFMCRRGEGVRKDQSRATDLFRKACNGGHSSACANLQ